MGTKLQPAIDVLERESFFTVSEMKDLMERALEQRTIEEVKKTMLKQEETFKQQVMELHRLYRVQRMLMAEMKNEMTEQREYLKATVPSSSQGTVGLGHNFRIKSDDRDEQKLELSRSCSSDTNKGEQHSKANIGFDFGIMASSSRTSGVSHTGLRQDLCGVDLTLSIGGSNNSSEATKSREEETSLGIRESSGDEKRPPWGLL